jgi:cytochrome c-type biogenesis protein CcmH
MRVILLLWLFLFAAPAFAIGVDRQTLADPAQEARARALMHELRCLVCQNQSISDSDATLAVDLRGIVRERIAAGDSDAQVKAYLVKRYGDWVLLDPPLNATTFLLWSAPLLTLGGGLLLWRRRTRGAALEAAPLSEDERAALERLQ